MRADQNRKRINEKYVGTAKKITAQFEATIGGTSLSHATCYVCYALFVIPICMPATCYRTQERNGITRKGILTETNPMISQFCTENPTNHLGSRAMKRQKTLNQIYRSNQKKHRVVVIRH